MSRIQAKLLLLVVVAFVALALAGPASAGWTWDGNAGWAWVDDGSAE